MNEELTPEERAAMRARIVGGARGIKPVGAHRGAVIAGAIAAVLVIAIAGGVAATSTLSAPQIATTPSPTATASTPTPSPPSTPSPTVTAPAGPVVAFGGDCGQLMTDGEASNLVRGGEASSSVARSLATDTTGSLALLGGLSCTWNNQNDGFTVVVAAAEAIAPAFASSLSAVTCSNDGGCSLGRTEGDLWIGVEDWSVPADYREFTADEVAQASARLDRVITLVGRKPHTTPVLTIGGVRSNAWSLSDCEALQTRLEGLTGTSLTTQPLEGTSLVPDTLAYRVAASSAGVTSCAYRDVADDSRGSILVSLMPGASTPPPGLLDQSDVLEMSMAGAEHAWGQVPYDTPYMLELAATVGADRLSLRRMSVEPTVTDAPQIAAAVIEFVRGGD